MIYMCDEMSVIIQEKDAFTRANLNAIAEKLDLEDEDPNKTTPTPLSVILKPHHNTLTGNYDINVLIAALEEKGKRVIWHDRRHGASSIDLDEPEDKLFGIVLNVRLEDSDFSGPYPFKDIEEIRVFLDDVISSGAVETRVLRTDIVYDCGQNMNPAVDLGQGTCTVVQGLGFFVLEEYSSNSDGLVVADGTWTYNIRTSSTIPKQLNIEVLNSGHHQKRVLSSKGETRVLRTDIVYDCGQSMNPAVDLGQIEGAFVQGLGFFMLQEYSTNSNGLVVADRTWTYKIPTIDTIPKQFIVEVLNSGHHQKRVLSSKASGEPPLLLAASVHCATRAAIKEARKQLKSWGVLEGTDSTFQLDVPATMPVVKQLCALNYVEAYLAHQLV
ncbi:aryl-alcohol oxidase 3 [Castilleja foliolosa]|uniref:ubiquitinyl hydrolase 1 n=1 Tax=Castilleja foliolosa TaxID=1961234 RepID=A0ABD3EJ54_9LAMI